MAFAFAEPTHQAGLGGRLVTGLDLSNDGSRLAVSVASGGDSPAVLVYDTATDALIAELGTGGIGRGVALSGDGQQVVYLARDTDGNCQLVRAGLPDGSAEHIADYQASERCHGLARSRTGQYVAVLGTAIEVWDMAAREVVRFKDSAVPDELVCGCFGGEGLVFFSYGTASGTIEHIDWVADRVVGQLAAPRPFGQQVAVSPSGDYLVAVAKGGMGVFVYHLPNGERVLPDRYNEQAYTTRFVFAAGSPVLVQFAVGLQGHNLQTGDFIFGPEIAITGDVTAAAAAWDAPLVAFAAGGHVFWGQLEGYS